MKEKFLNLGNQPITNKYLTKAEFSAEYFFNLSVGFDADTKLVSLMDFVNPEKMFDDMYAHRASASLTMTNAFRQIADYIETKFNPKKILEIGSNDGVFIRNFPKEKILAVEPCANLAALTNSLGYVTYSQFYTSDLADQIREEHGQVDVIYAANTICHIPDLQSALKAIFSLLSPNGIFIFEDPSVYSVVQANSYDQFYDEHAHLFSILALEGLLKEAGLKIFNVETLTTHGGSNRIYAKKIDNSGIDICKSVGRNIENELRIGLDQLSTYHNFAERVRQSKTELITLLTELKAQGKTIVSYGATYKSTTIYNFCNINSDLISYIVDITPGKQGKYSPGAHIPIVSPEKGFNSSVDYTFLGAWNFIDEILQKEKLYLDRGGKFITHVPNVRVV
jgi:methylation protein EvaC